MNCTECYKDPQSLNDQLKQNIIEAQKYATENNTKVAIIQEGAGYSYQAFITEIPAGTREIVIPGK